jgi:hypothetical protein
VSSDSLNVKVVSNQNSVELTKNENTVVISDKNRDTSINVLQKETVVVTVASKGPKGDKGDKGDMGIAVTNQIATGSITASVDVGTNTFRVQSGSSTYFYISSSGNVGIGTTNPTLGLLQLNTSTAIPNPSLYINASGVGTTASIVVRSNNGASVPTQKTYNPVGGSDSLNFIQLLDGDTTSTTNQPIGRIIFSSNDADSGGTNTTKAFIEAVSEDATPDTFLAFGTAQASTSVTERMRITSVGNVGIGTTAPTNTLQVNGGITATYLTTSYIDINTTAGITQPIEGRLSWDNTDGTLDIGLKGGNISLQVGQEQVVRVVNKTDGNLLKSEYKVVRIRRTDEGGAQGQRLAIRLSQANNDPNSVDTLGLVAEDINDNQEGYIITSGLLHNINTTGTLQSETWYDGDVLYLSPTVAGALTNIKPIAPNHTVIVGFVVYAHNNQGKIFVKVDNGYEIDELHNVRINTSSLAVGDLLIYSSSVWTNSKQMTGSYVLNGNVTVTGTASINTLVVNQTQLSTGSNQLGDNINDTQTLYGSVIIPTGSLTVTGSLNVISGITGSLFGTSSWAINALTASFITPTGTNAFVQGGNSFGTTALLGTNDTQDLQFETSGSVRMTISSSGNIGIGTTSPLSTLTVAGGNININNGYGIGGNFVGTYTSFITYHNDGLGFLQSASFGFRRSAYMDSIAYPDIFGLGTNDLRFFTSTNGIAAPSEIMRMVGSTGFVGIGETSPSAKLEIKGSGATSATTALRVENNNATSLLTILNDGTSAFNTSHLYVSSSGNVGIGTATPVHNLVVNGNTGVSINANGATFPNIHRDSTDGGMLLRSWNGSIFTTNVKITPTTEVGIGTTTPTAELHISGANADALLRVSSPAVNNILFVTGSGRVGIGTSNPGVTLDVVGGSIRTSNTMFNSTTQTNTIQLSSATNLQFLSASVETARYDNNGWGFFNTAPAAKVHISGANADNLFGVSSPSATNALFVTGSGNVGIGTSNPLSLLHITASSGNEFLRITSGSQNILNVRSGSVVFFAGTGVSPTANFDLDVQGTGTANGGTVRFTANSTIWTFAGTSAVSRGSTGNSDMFNVSMTGTSATLVQNPMSITFNANQSTTGGGGYTVLRVNATHATTAGTGSKLLQTWEFGGTQRSVVNITGSIGVGITTPSASVHISSSLGLAPILAITPHHPLPTTNIPTGSFMVSSSTPPKPFFWDGTTWNALY